ncbi:MAG TPA: N-acetylmuramoyl-L-alanine amidase family protein [Atribacterota bacterium]|nr:N-acetylmuramoyl-L-alanine amidase family protein [Atribacterota bacterium]
MLGKKNIINFIILFLILSIFISNILCLAQQKEVSVFLDGNKLNTEVTPNISNGRIFLPARDIVEALGGRITWFPALKLLNITMRDREISVVMDVPEAEVNGKDIAIENAPSIIENRVMIPLEVVSLLTDIEADLDKESNQLNINRKRPLITSIRDYTHPDKTRIVLDLSEKTAYNVLTLSDPERIVIDVDASINQLESKQKEVIIDDLLVSRVRTGQFNQDTARVVADLKNMNEYDVFELSSPQRIVLDIYMPQDQVGSIAESSVSPEVREETLPETKPEAVKENGKYVVVIDPGHGGSQPGAIGPSGLKEKDVVLDVALRLKRMLQNDGFSIHMTREKDVDVSLESRPLMALQKEADVFISIHINSVFQKGSHTARGVETYVLSSKYIGASAKDVADRENKANQYHNYENQVINQIIADLEESASIDFSLDLADMVQKRLVQHTGLGNRGVKQAPFIVLKGVNMAAVLVEVGFICNPNEEKLLKTSEFREKIAQALSQSVKDYLKNMPENI